MYTRNFTRDADPFRNTQDSGYEIDRELYLSIRNNITKFIKDTIVGVSEKRILEIGPENFIANINISEHNSVDTVDIIPNSITTYVSDMTVDDNRIPSNTYDVVYCLEVLEHCSSPLKLMSNIWRVLKPNGTLHLSTPFNFRLHGPIPDFYRFSHFGLKQLADTSGFNTSNISGLICPTRVAFPVHYTCSFIKQL